MDPDQHDHELPQQFNQQQPSYWKSQYASTKTNNFNSYDHQIAVEIIIKIIQRNYSRHFIKRLMFAYIENLRKSQTVVAQPRRPVQQVNWPFRDLYLKKYRTQDENQLFQFVNLCAVMIQSKFKAYITRKRHLAAYQKAAKTKDVLQSFIKRWKAYRTYNCKKIVQIRGKIKEIQKEIDQQQENYANRDAKKLKGLYKYLQIHNKMFKQAFNLLMETGMWTLQQNMKQNVVKKPTPPPRQQRVREFRGQNKQVKRFRVENQQNPSTISMENEIKKQNIDQNISNQFLNSYPNKSQWSTGSQDRPIKATGEYKISEEELVKSYVEPKIKKNFGEDETAKDQGDKEPAKAKQRMKKAQQLQKRTKYDPRKAIQEEKNRKKQENQKNKNQIKVNDQLTKQVIENKESSNKVLDKKTPSKNKKLQTVQAEPNLDQKQKPKKIIKEKKLQAKQKPVVELENSNSKQLKVIKKVSSKVDCWVNKKEPEPEWVKSYKSRLLENRQQSQEKTLQNLRKSVERNVSIKKEDKIKVLNRSEFQEKQQIGEPRKNRLQSQQQERERISQTWKQKHREIQNLKQKQDEFAGKRKNSTHNLQEQIKAILQKKNNMTNLKKKQAHRPIEQLEQTYNKHYGDRYQNLMPKLSLLAVARNQQRRTRIPVISDQNEQFDNWFESLYHSTHYWKMISQQDRIYKSFLSS